jgi:hypothetical protein
MSHRLDKRDESAPVTPLLIQEGMGHRAPGWLSYEGENIKSPSAIGFFQRMAVNLLAY